MKKILNILTGLVAVIVAAGTADAAVDRRSMVAAVIAPAPRVIASTNQLNAMHGLTTDKSSTQPVVVDPLFPATDKEPDMREKEKAACLNNNIGAGNTFVWASKYSNTNNYASMVEDVDNPANNVCFVKVEIKSADGKISVADIRPVYFEMGRNITCGSWVDENMMRDRILSARKGARTWGTVAGSVGGAGVGVGAMELFGNRLIGGSVMGQKDKNLNEMELLRSQMLTMQEKGDANYGQLAEYLRELRDACNDAVWDKTDAAARPEVCGNYNFDILPL